MSVHLATFTSFDHVPVGSLDHLDHDAWSGAATSMVTGWDGTGQAVNAPTTLAYTKPSVGSSWEGLTAYVRFKITTLPSGANRGTFFGFHAAGVHALSLYVKSDGLLYVSKSTSTDDWAATMTALSTGVWYTIEIGVSFDDAVGSFGVRLNGQAVTGLSQTGVDTLGTSASVDSVHLGNRGGVSTTRLAGAVDDFVLWSDSSTSSTTMPLYSDRARNPKIATLRPTGQGVYADWTLGTGSGAHNLEVDEAVEDGDTSYLKVIYPNTSAKRESYVLTPLPNGAENVLGLVARAWLKTSNQAHFEAALPFFRLDEQDIDGANVNTAATGAAYTGRSHLVSAHPVTQQPMTRSDLSSLEAGIASSGGTWLTGASERMSAFVVEALYMDSGLGGTSTGLLSVPMTVEWWDQGAFGFAPPHNPKVKSDISLTGTLKVTRRAVTNPVIDVPVLVSTAAASGLALRLGYKVSGRILPTFTVGGRFLSHFKVNSPIVFGVTVGGEVNVDTTLPLTREFFALRDGVRPSFPWLIYAMDVVHISQVVQDGVFRMESDRPFIISHEIDLASDPLMAVLGGKPNWIGMVVDTVVNDAPAQEARFREPELNEVVFVLATRQALRWDGVRWSEYATMPERAIDNQLVFELLDPSGRYRSYAQILGLMLVEWQYDTEHLATLRDPLRCPDAQLSSLAVDLGLDVINETPVPDKREFIRSFAGLQRLKGRPDAIVEALRLLGYRGHGTHVWVLPGGGPTDYIEKPFGYDVDTPSTYFPASQVAVHMNAGNGARLPVIDSGMREAVAEFLTKYALPPHVRIRFFATDVACTPSDGVSVSDSFTITQV